MTDALLALKLGVFTGTMEERESLPIPLGVGNLKQKEVKGQKCPSLRTAREETEVRILLLSPRHAEKTEQANPPSPNPPTL